MLLTQLFLLALSYKFLKMKHPPYADLWSFFKKKPSSSHSSNLRGFVPPFLLRACCLSQSCTEAWLKFSSFSLSLWSETLLLCHDGALSACDDGFAVVNCERQMVSPIGSADFLHLNIRLRIRTNGCLFSHSSTPAA